MGKIVFIAIAIFASQLASAKTFEATSRNVEIYSEAVNRISSDHVLQIPMDKTLYLKAIVAYANKLDLYKIVFHKEELSELVAKLPAEGTNTQLEVEIIYELYNRYIARLQELQSTLPNLQPTHPKTTHLSKDIAANANELKQSQNDFVYERYLRAKIAASPENSIPALLRELIRVEIDNANMQTLSQPLTHYLNALGETLDPHTYFTSNDEAENKDAGLMGITFEQAEGFLNIVSVFSGSNAEKSGIKAGDKLLAYAHNKNSELVYMSTMNFEEFGRMATAPVRHVSSVLVQKPDGSVVNLDVARSAFEDLGGLGLPFLPTAQDTPPAKEPTRIPALEKNRIVKLHFAKAKNDNKVYPVVQVSSFVYDEDKEELSIAIEMLNVLKTLEIIWSDSTIIQKQIILDLKNNGGGLAKQAVTLAQMFLDQDVFIQTVQTGGEKLPFLPEPGYKGKATGIPLVVWVNEGCASACEMFTSIIQDTGRGLIVGARTDGKGVGQLQNAIEFPQIDFSFGLDSFLDLGEEDTPPSLAGHLAITMFTYYRLNGESVQLNGIQPDVTINSGNEFSKIGMRYTTNPIPNSTIPAPEPELLQTIDASLIARLQAASLERWASSAYADYTVAHQNLAKALSSEDATSFDLEARKTFKANILHAQQALDAKKVELSTQVYSYNLYDIDQNPQLDAINQAGLQEFMNVSTEYFNQGL